MLKKVQNTNYLACMKAKKITQPRCKITSQQDQSWITVDKVAGGTGLMIEVKPGIYRVGVENQLLRLFSDLHTHA